MDKRDLNLQLCSDDPIFVGGVPIYPIPISEIAKIGYMRFNAEVRLLCLNESDISAMTGNDISDIWSQTQCEIKGLWIRFCFGSLLSRIAE